MKTILHKFVEFIPDQPEEGVLYITIEYRTAVHRCICGCGNKVVTPLSPTDWKLTFDGKTVSLHPSIGNWNFECRSHYFITRNEIRNCPVWTEPEVGKEHEKDKKTKNNYFGNLKGKLTTKVRKRK